MAQNTEASFNAPRSVHFASAALAPLRVIDGFFQSIIASNRLARDVENLSHASDRQLADMGLTRDQIVGYAAARSENFRTL
ncbi:DUF1127 domain-containing protein [Primorskyibacter sp. S87]|uniref:DUF1127 domain-containing protein n=1 Tax=Primorskyibacter sp. S87 TaxID=3415126 RepID=UPI003C7A130A